MTGRSPLPVVVAALMLAGCTAGPRVSGRGAERVVEATLERVVEDLDRASLEVTWAVLRLERAADRATVRMLTPDDRTVVASVAPGPAEGQWRVTVDAGVAGERDADAYLRAFTKLLRDERMRRYQGGFDWPPRE